MKRFFQFLIFFQFCITCYCQERKATIVFIDNTTMEGLGEIKRNKIYFRISEEDKKTEWNYEMAKGIIFSGYGFYEKYEYQKPDKYSNPIIMEVLEEGNINLYRKNKIEHTFSDSNFFDINKNALEHHPTIVSAKLDSDYYVKRPNEDFTTDISFSFKNRAKKYFSDCPDILAGIEDKSYDRNTIQDMVIYYNKYCNTKK